MGFLAPLAALLGLEVEGMVARAKAAAIIYGFIGLFLLAAFCFLLAAGHMALAERVGPIVSALIFAGTFLVLALAVYLGSLIGHQKHQRKLTERRRASESGAFLTTAAVTALPLLLRSPAIVKLGIPAAAIAALAILRDGKDD